MMAMVFALAGCPRLGRLGSGAGALLTRDAAHLRADDAGRPGLYGVEAEGRVLPFPGGDVPMVVYRPVGTKAPAPAVVFLPGRFAPEEQYESYARLLASRGFVVVVRGRYSFFHPDVTLGREAIALEVWLSSQPFVDPTRIGIAGHSMGGRDAIMAAANDTHFRAVVTIDPGGPNTPAVIEHFLGTLRAPLLIIGAEVAWRGWQICSPRATNYQHYFAGAPAGTVELTLLGADHVQVMDDPDAFGQVICRVGTADSRDVRAASRRATLQFFEEHLMGAAHVPLETGRIATVRVREVPSQPIDLPGSGVAGRESNPRVRASVR